MSNKRLLLGFMLAPLTVPVLFLIGAIVLSNYTSQGPGHLWKLVTLTTGALLPLSYIATLGFGVPLFIFLQRIGRLDRLNLAISAAAIGLLMGYLLGSYYGQPGENVLHPDFLLMLAGGVSGILVSLTFCFIVALPRHSKAV